jgi:CubicO group peptidase (beta-lactamase class C family)
MGSCRFIPLFQLYYLAWKQKRPGRISSTAADLLKWDKALYTEKLINQSTLQEAFTPMKLNDGSFSDYGFGWSLRTDPAFGKIVSHNGDNPGYKTQIIRYIDKRKTIILLNNNAHKNFGIILKELEALIK